MTRCLVWGLGWPRSGSGFCRVLFGCPQAAELRAQRHVNSVSSIDRVARVLFPASFALLNLAYWVAYGGQVQDFSWHSRGVALYLDH